MLPFRRGQKCYFLPVLDIIRLSVESSCPGQEERRTLPETALDTNHCKHLQLAQGKAAPNRLLITIQSTAASDPWGLLPTETKSPFSYTKYFTGFRSSYKIIAADWNPAAQLEDAPTAHSTLLRCRGGHLAAGKGCRLSGVQAPAHASAAGAAPAADGRRHS